ncbi:MAG: HAD family hydrolase, partial [Candidatus Thermoplasmatota archaeon]|nr:HAD family hydrolase [Candidatus Thermoplasmatota archaeon]
LEKYFDEVFTARDLKTTKPDSAFYRGILRKLELVPEEVVMIGDDFETDIAGAKKTGLWTIWYNPSDNELPIGLEEMADVVIRRYSDMENALMLISGRASRTIS